MNSVDSDGIDWMEIRQWLAIWPTERNVPSEGLHGTAGFDPSHHIAFGQMLVFEAHLGLRIYAYFIQASQHSLRQGEPPTRQRILFVRHVPRPYADCRRGIGQPTARRIISLRQPAQHRYFRGSSMEIAKLSPLRS